MRLTLLLMLSPFIMLAQPTLTDSAVIIKPDGEVIRYSNSRHSATYVDGDSIGFRGTTTKRIGLVSPLSFPVSSAMTTALNGKQATLISGSNIKTINGNNILGSGDIAISGTAAWGSVTGTLSSQTDLQTALDGKQPLNSNLTTIAGLTATTDNMIVGVASAWASRTPAQVKTALAINNLDNTSDANKPVSTAQQTALNLKANLASPTFTGTVSGITATMVGLGNVTNESKATMFTSPAFTGTPTGITATHVGLGNVTNESKATMFTSPAFTGTPTGIGLPVTARVTGSNATTTGQALVDITGLSIALTTNATYEFYARLSVSTSAVTTGTQYGVQYSVANGTVEAGIIGSSTSTAVKAERISALNTATTAYLTTSAQSGSVTISGIVTTGANAGNLTIRHLKVTSGTSTVFINSHLTVTRIL